MPVKAVQHVRRMRGGAQGHLMRCKDGHFYVVKLQNNPQHIRVLANELLATRLAERVGLPVPPAEIIEIEEWIAGNTPDFDVQVAGERLPCKPGLHFGSRYAADPVADVLYDYLPEPVLARVRNLADFCGMLAFDKWTGNVNGRQAVFTKRPRERNYTATFIDHGYCFNAGEWTFADSPLRGVYARNLPYVEVSGWESFEPWLSRIEAIELKDIVGCAADIPPEWYGGAIDELECLVDELHARRNRVRQLITDFRRSSRQPFPQWEEAASGSP